MGKNHLYYRWLDQGHSYQNPSSSSDVAEDDVPPFKKRKRSPSLTPREQSCPSESIFLPEPYDREREEYAKLVHEIMLELMSIFAEPRITCQPPDILCPESIISLRRRLITGFGMKLIPLEFKDRIENPYLSIPDGACDDGGLLSPEKLETLWQNINELYTEAKECNKQHQDENAYALVAYDILKYALGHNSIFRLKDARLQMIQPELLPRLLNHNLDEISSGKISYVLVLSTQGQEIEDLLFSFQRAQIYVGVTTDIGLEGRPLFAGIVVRGADGNREEARFQLSCLFAAQFKKLVKLSKLQGKDMSKYELPLLLGFTVIGCDWHLYSAYKSLGWGKETMYVDEFQLPVGCCLVSDSYYGIFQIVDLVRRVASYLEGVYWPLLSDILSSRTNAGVQA